MTTPSEALGWASIAFQGVDEEFNVPNELQQPVRSVLSRDLTREDPVRAGLPWPAAPQPLLAAPRLLRPPADAWLCSATLHVAERAVAPQLAAALGWEAPPRVSVLAAQLLELGRMHAHKPKRIGLAAAPAPAPAESESSPVAAVPPAIPAEAVADAAEADAGAEPGAAAVDPAVAAAAAAAATAAAVAEQQQQQHQAAVAAALAAANRLAQSLESAVARLYAALGEAVDGPEGDLVAMSFERPDTPCVWVGMTITPAPAAPTAPASPAPGSEGTAGAVAALVEVSGGFVSPAAAALRADGGGDFRPYLWLVPEPLQRHGRLLGLMGVRDRCAGTLKHCLVCVKTLLF